MRDYTDLTLPELTRLLTERSLATDGVKDSLVSRLEAYDAVNDPSPSPELHLSPVCSHAQPPQDSLPTHHLPTEPDEDYVDWGDGDDDGVRTATVAEFDVAVKAAAEAARAKDKVAGDNPAAAALRSRSGSIDGFHRSDSQPSVVSPTPVEKVSKSGYKYNSIAAMFFPDSAAMPSSPKAPPKSPPAVSTAATKAINTPRSTPATPSKAPASAPALPASNSTTAAKSGSPVKVATPFKAPTRSSVPIQAATAPAAATTVSKADFVLRDSLTAAAAAALSPNKKATPAASHVRRTTQTGFQFNSVSALFPVTAAAVPTIPPRAIANVVANAAATLTPKEEEARKLAMRAARFGSTPKEPAVSKVRKHGRADVDRSAAAKEKEKEKERKLEIETEKEKEREREKIRKRVTSTSASKRSRNDDDDENNYKRQHRSAAAAAYVSSKTQYSPQRRY